MRKILFVFFLCLTSMLSAQNLTETNKLISKEEYDLRVKQLSDSLVRNMDLPQEIKDDFFKILNHTITKENFSIIEKLCDLKLTKITELINSLKDKGQSIIPLQLYEFEKLFIEKKKQAQNFITTEKSE